MAEPEIRYRWDVLWSEGNAARTQRYLDEGVKRRKDGELDRRYKRARFIEDYRAGKLWFG